MGIKTNLNIAPYFDDYEISKKYYRVLFKPGYAVQARELTQLQSTLQNQIEQFGENIYKEGSIIKGCTFTELRNLKYVKVVDGIRPESYIERTEINENTDVIDEYYYELEDVNGLKALVVQGTTGFQSRAPDLNTFFVLYLNTVTVGGVEKKTFEANDTLEIKEYILRTQMVDDETIETTIENGTVATTSVANFSNPIGASFGLNAAEGVIFQRGHFLFVDDQTIVVKKYLTDSGESEFNIQPHEISVGYIVDETIVNSQGDLTLLDNAIGSPNENAPGADRLMLVPRLVARPTSEAEGDNEFFILRRYENGYAIETRSVTQFNSISKELARRTYETHGDYTKEEFKFDVVKDEGTGDFYIEMGEGIAYSKGYRVSNEAKRFFRIPPIENTSLLENQPINFDYGGYCPVVAATGRATMGTLQNVALLDAASTEIGSAVVKNYDADRLYLFGIRMSANTAFKDVKYVKEGALGQVEITPRLINSSESKMIFDSKRSFVSSFDDISFSVRKSKVAPSASGTITVEPEVGEVFNADSLKDILVIQHNDNQKATITASEISGGNLVITSSTSATQNVTVFYNILVSAPEPRLKQMLDVYVKTTFSDDTRRYTLGLPDVAEVLEIKDSANNDFTDSFQLQKNQQDDYYDHSYIERIQGRPKPNNGQVLTIKVKTFRVDSSSDLNFFTPDSYINIDKKYVGYHITKSGKAIDLKSSIDFRPYRIPTAAYSVTEVGATTLAGGLNYPDKDTELFSSSITYGIPSVNTSATVDIEYYANRTDYIEGNSQGRFRYIVGDEIASKTGKINDSDTTTIVEVRVPGYPLLTKDEAVRYNRRNETIKLVTKTVKTYTMKDIDSLSKKIDRLLYYTTVNALESSAKNLLIQDENGLSRFKNGIIVDPFNDLMIGDLSDPDFNSSVDFTEKSLYPSIKQFPIDLRLKPNSLNGAQTFNNDKILTLSSNQLVRFIRQQYATSYRTCTSNFYNYKGTGYLIPDFDFGYDTVTTPTTVEIDLATPFADFADALNEFIPLTATDTTLIDEETQTQTVDGEIITDTISEFEDILKQLKVTSGDAQNQYVGDFVTNFQFKPYIRNQEISVEIYGLRPNTRHYFFFDGKDVNAFVAPGRSNSDLSRPYNSLSTVEGVLDIPITDGEFGDAVTSNDNGELFAVFRIPEDTFLVGERELLVVDVDDIGTFDSAGQSSGKMKFNAYNFSVEKTGLTISTRVPEIDIETTTTTRTVVDRDVQPIVVPGIEDDNFGNWTDPLAQTFFIKDEMTQGSGCLYVGRLDLYFKRKSATNGVTVMLREVENGYPSKEILPFSKKHLRTGEVNVSDDASLATSIYFDTPVRLDSEKEYCVVIMPDAADPDYLIFTQKVGGTDLITGNAVNSDWGDGVLFTSTNNRAWKSYQDEDIKFDLYRYNFNTDLGTAELVSKSLEFFTIESAIGRFRDNELVYAFPEIPSVTYQVILDKDSNVIEGTGLNNYSVGDFMYVANGSGAKDLLSVVEVVSSTEIVVNRSPKFSGTFNSRPAVGGRVTYYNYRNPTSIILDNSSAREGRHFNAGDTIYGFRSDSSATIVSVDNTELSYIQPMISRITDADTNVKAAVKVINPASPNDLPYLSNINFATKKMFNEKGCIIYSKSNDVDGEKQFIVRLTLEKDAVTTDTPLVDIETAKLFAYIYNVSEDPETTSRYISKKVELKEGFDAEDFKIWLTGYRPKGTDIKVYMKLKNEADPVIMRNNDWIELVRVEGETLFSSTSNTNDYKEFVYEIPDDKKVEGVVQYSNDTGVYQGFRSFSIRIDLLAETPGNVPKVLDYRGVAFE